MKVTHEELEQSIAYNASLILNELLAKEAPKVPFDYSCILLFNKIAQVLGIKRTRVYSTHIGNGSWLVNMYSIMFLASGTGKDRLHNYISYTLMKDIMREVQIMYEEQYKVAFKSLVDLSIKKFPDNEGLSKAWLSRNLPYDNYLFNAMRGTQEGIYEARKSLSNFEFGSVNFFNGEFTDYYTSRNETNKDFLDAMKNTWYGDNDAVLIKSDKSIKAIHGVPMNMLVHSANLRFLRDKVLKTKLLDFLSDGMARRSYVVVSHKKKLDIALSLDEYEAKRLSHNKEKEGIEEFAASKFNELSNHLFTTINPSYRLTAEADKEVTNYSMYLNSEIDKILPEYIASEVEGRLEKVIKLACIMSAFELPKEQWVNVDFVKKAIIVVEYYSKQYEKYFLDIEKQADGKLKQYLLDNVSKWVSKTDIRNLDLHDGNFTRWLEENISFIESDMYGTDYELQSIPNGSRGSLYRIISKGDSIKEKEKEIAETYENKLRKERGENL